MAKILIKNGNIIDPKNNIDDILDLLIEDGKVCKIGENICDNDVTTIDATGCWVVPGLIDLHVHLREPGFTHKETIKTGTLSAVKGGVTTLCAMPNTNPVMDSPLLVEYFTMKCEKDALMNVLPVGAITKGMMGEEISPIGSMKEKGICAISEDGKSVLNCIVMKTALNYSRMFDLPIFSHCEDESLKGDGQINEGIASINLGLKGISNDVEDVITGRDIILANNYKNKLHICHVSTRGSIDLIEFGKKQNPNLTCEVCPHHFTLIDEDITDYDGNFKMAPPLRSKDDRARILEAIKNDIVDVIATDHAPHSVDEKTCEFDLCANGIVGLETLVPLTISELVNKEIINKRQFVEKTSLNPAKILGIDKGHLSVGAIADVVVINPAEKFKIDKETFGTMGRNTPFHNREVTGKVKYTYVAGKLAYCDLK
ncbi:MAG: dihydroorotase [Lachnospirales bacterium]